VQRLFKSLPPQDVGDSKVFLAAAITLFEGYPPDVGEKAVFEIATKTDRPTLRIMKEVLDDLNSAEIERQRREDGHRLALPHIAPRAKRTPEEKAKVDAQCAELRKAFGLKTPEISA